MPKNALLFVDESHVMVPQIGGMFKGDYMRKSTLSEYGFRLPSCMDNRPLKFEEWDEMRGQTVLGPWIGAARRPDLDFQRFVDVLAERHPQWPAALRLRLARCYGARIELLLAGGGLGRAVAPGLHEAELHYLHTHEWARSADDVLWRRTKLGLHLDAAGRAAVHDWCSRHWSAPQEPAAAERTLPA